MEREIAAKISNGYIAWRTQAQQYDLQNQIIQLSERLDKCVADREKQSEILTELEAQASELMANYQQKQIPAASGPVAHQSRN